MTDAKLFTSDLRRYRQLLAEQLPPSSKLTLEASLEGPTALQIERGEILVGAVSSPSQILSDHVERLIEIASSAQFAQAAVIDMAGHHRPVYRPLLAYTFIQSFRLLYEMLPRGEFGRWEEGARAWADALEEELHEVIWPPEGTPASRGDSAGEAVWAALALHVAGKVFVRDAFTDQAADVFGKLVRGQQSSGNFLTPSASDNPETHWYHELVLLHAAASYAVQAEDRVVASAVARATQFHQNETQPDHASTQPWAIFAFLWNPATHSLADQLIHAARTQNPAGPRGISAILLADAIVCIDQFL